MRDTSSIPLTVFQGELPPQLVRICSVLFTCRFATYVQPTNAPKRIVKLDGQEPLQGAANAAEAALQVGGTSAHCCCAGAAERCLSSTAQPASRIIKASACAMMSMIC